MPCGVLHAAVQAGDALRRFARSSSGGGCPAALCTQQFRRGNAPWRFVRFRSGLCGGRKPQQRITAPEQNMLPGRTNRH